MSTETAQRGKQRAGNRLMPPGSTRQGARRILSLLLLLLCALTLPSKAGKPQAQAASPVAELAGKARALDLRGRFELARQTWEQVLQLEPDNTEALGGVVRCLRAAGHEQEAEQYLERARSAHPENAGLAQLTRSGAGESKSAELREAEQLNRKGRSAEAVVLFRRLYGEYPPAGEVSLAYFAAEGATQEGRPHAIAGLRDLCDRFPDDARYAKALGSLLVQNVRTRGEGQKLLAGSSGGKGAILLAGKSTPPSVPARRTETPATTEPNASAAGPATPAALVPAPSAPVPQLSETARSAPQAQPAAPPANSAKEPGVQNGTIADASSAAGPKPLSLGQAPSAATNRSAMEASPVAEAKAATSSGLSTDQSASAVRSTLAPARSAAQGQISNGDAEMERAGFAALNAGRLREAEAKFKVLLARNGDNIRASGGLGLVRARQANWSEALPLLERAQHSELANPAFTRALRQARAASGEPAVAVVVSSAAGGGYQEPVAVAVRPSPSKAAETRQLTALALPRRSSPALSSNISGTASEAAPIPSGSTEAKLSRAAALAAAGEERAASSLFAEVTAAEPQQTRAWIGLIVSLHRQKDDSAALNAIDRMPREGLQTTLRAPEFAAAVAAVEENEGRVAAARQVLESLLAQAPQPPDKSYAAAQLQLASLLLQTGQPAQAYGLFRAAVASQPETLDGWAGLIAALHATDHDREALAQLGSVPPALRVQMESNPLFLQTAPLLYAGVNDTANALAYWSRLQQFAAAGHTSIPATLSLEQAEWLGRVGDESHLYQALMSLGNRSDLSDEQRRAVQQVWAEWAVRQATQQARNGNPTHAGSILSAAAAAFAGNVQVMRTLAFGYATASLPRNAVTLLRTQNLSNANAEDLTAAVNAALAARDLKQAEVWLRPALVHYPADPDLLLLASRFETEAGHRKESAAYYQAALNAAQARHAALASTGDQAKTSSPATVATVSANSPDLAIIFAGVKAAGVKVAGVKPSPRNKPTQLSSADGSRPYLPGTMQSTDVFPRPESAPSVSR